VQGPTLPAPEIELQANQILGPTNQIEEKVASVAPPWWTPPQISIAGTASETTKYHDRIHQQSKNDPKHLLMYSDGSNIKGGVRASSWCPKLKRRWGPI
jgi:hypothetical protein